MAILSKSVESASNIPSVSRQQNSQAVEKLLKLEPKLQQARELMAKGQYQLALGVLPTASRDIEVRNACAVCLLRTHRYEQAIDMLRTVALNSKTNRVREDVPDHVRINFAIALFFGGQPAGGLEALLEINREEDPSVIMLREHARKWVAEMSFFRRLDWRLNRVAPKQRPVPPTEPVGMCIWDLA